MSIRNNPDEGNSDIGRSPLPNSPDLAYLLALLSLPQMGPSRLTKLLESESAESIWVKCATVFTWAQTQLLATQELSTLNAKPWRSR